MTGFHFKKMVQRKWYEAEHDGDLRKKRPGQQGALKLVHVDDVATLDLTLGQTRGNCSCRLCTLSTKSAPI